MKTYWRLAVGFVLLVVALGVAGCGSDSKDNETEKSGSGVTVAQGTKGTPVAVEVGEKTGDELYMTVSPESVAAGPVTFTVSNVGKKKHEMVALKTDTPFDQLDVTNHEVSEDTRAGEAEVEAGATKSVTLDLEPGKYVLVCNLEKHYENGMRAAFTVTP